MSGVSSGGDDDMSACASCANPRGVFDDGAFGRVCMYCGWISGSVPLYGDVEAKSGAQYVSIYTGAPLTRSYEKVPLAAADYRQAKYRRHLNAQLLALAGAFGLTQTDVGAVRAICHRQADGRYGCGRWYKLLQAAAVYIVCRLHHRALTVAEVAHAVTVSTSILTHIVRRICADLHVRLDIAQPITFISHIVTLISIPQSAFRQHVERDAEQLLHFIDVSVSHELTGITGKTPVATTVAAVITAIQAQPRSPHGANKTASPRHSAKHYIDLLAGHLHLSSRTLSSRLNVIHSALLSLAQYSLPSMKHVTLKSIAPHMPFIIQNIWKLNSQQQETLRNSHHYQQNIETNVSAKNVTQSVPLQQPNVVVTADDAHSNDDDNMLDDSIIVDWSEYVRSHEECELMSAIKDLPCNNDQSVSTVSTLPSIPSITTSSFLSASSLLLSRKRHRHE